MFGITLAAAALWKQQHQRFVDEGWDEATIHSVYNCSACTGEVWDKLRTWKNKNYGRNFYQAKLVQQQLAAASLSRVQALPTIASASVVNLPPTGSDFNISGSFNTPKDSAS